MAASGNNEDPTWVLFLFLAIVTGLLWLVWHFFRVELLGVMRYIRLTELFPLTFFDSTAKACFIWLRQAPSEGTLPTDAGIGAAAGCFGTQMLASLHVKEAMKFYTLSPTSLGVVSRLALGYWRWLLPVFSAGAVYYILFVSKRDSFKTRHNLESFIKVQAKIWSVIAPIVTFNPSKHSARILGSMVPLKLPLFAEALAPEEWLSFHGIPVVGGIPDKERTRRALLAQMGPRWRGRIEDLPLYMLGLFAAFALKGVQKRDESDEFLGRLSLCWTAEKGFRPSPEMVAEIRKIVKDPQIGGKALEIAAKHAYRTTALLGTLRWARFMGGVLASAQFLWLRGVDRDLWYALNNLGRRSFHSEGAGAMAHYMAEEAAEKALPVPRLETALVSINQYLAANQPKLPPREGADKVIAR